MRHKNLKHILEIFVFKKCEIKAIEILPEVLLARASHQSNWNVNPLLTLVLLPPKHIQKSKITKYSRTHLFKLASMLLCSEEGSLALPASTGSKIKEGMSGADICIQSL